MISHKLLMMAYGNPHLMLIAKLLAIKGLLSAGFILKVHLQVIVMVFILCLMTGVLTYMLFYMYFKNVREKKHSKWLEITDQLIQDAIFFDEDNEVEIQDAKAPLADRAKKMIRDKHFRRFLVDEIISAKRSISGTSAEGLKHLYTQLRLDQYSLRSLGSFRWHVKAKAIQELTIMEMDGYVAELDAFTNNHNELVRMEAQTATIQFNGFDGLRFLDTITFPISDWQQIKLLQQLSSASPSDINMAPWLESSNKTVVVFALKLARNYNRFELYDNIIKCLDHSNPEVRLEALHCLCEIYTEDTSDEIISRFLRESQKIQLIMIKVMQSIASEKDILFLLSLLDDDNDEIKFHAASALANMGKTGMTSLEHHELAATYPLNGMLMELKGGVAA